MEKEQFADDIPSEGASLDIDKAFERLESKEDTTASESQSEKKETAEPSQGGENTPEEKPEPFHKHPRWIKTQQELKEAREKLTQLEKSQQQPLALPEWYKTRFGDTEEAKANYAEIVKQGGELEWLKQQVKDELRKEQETEEAQKREGEEYVETQLSEMKEEGLKFDANALKLFMVDFQKEYGSGSLLDAEGNYDFRKSLKLMQQIKPEDTSTNEVRKQVAAQSGRSKVSAASQSTVPVISRNALRRGNWRDAETGQFVSN